jgi:uncharacterized DUF497 family protein
MNFEWNQKKNRSNFHNHGVWFEEAQTIWADPTAIKLRVRFAKSVIPAQAGIQ